MYNELQNDLKGNDRNLTEVFSQYFSGWTEENHEKSYAGKLVSRVNFESSTSWIQICIVTPTFNLLD
jgi:hypothetical protein